MSQTLWILTERQESDDWDHSTILNKIKYLDTLCEHSGITKLSACLDESIIAEEFGMDVEPKYIESNTLHEIIKALKEQIDKGSNTVLVEELQDIQNKCLLAKGNKVRLAIVP